MFLPLLAAGQCKIKSDKVDEFTGERTVVAKEGLLGEVIEVAYRTDSSYYLYLSALGDDNGCARTGESKAMFKFADGSIVELVYLAQTNCKGNILVRLSDYLGEFSTKQITTIRLVGTRGSHTSEVKKSGDALCRG